MNPEVFKSHVVFEKLEQLKLALASEGLKDKMGLDNFLFFDSAYNYLADKLKLTIPLLVQEHEINSLSKEVETATEQINAYIGNNNIGHVNNAINNINTASTRIRNFPYPISKGDFDFSKSIAQFQNVLKEAYDSLKVQHDKLNAEVNNSKIEIDSKNQKIDALEKLIVEKQHEIQGLNTQQNAEFEALKNSSNTTLESERKRYSELLESDRKEIKESFSTVKDKYETSFIKQIEDLKNESNGVIEILQLKLAEAKKIVSIVGNVGVTGNYQKIADDHKLSANIFRWIAMGFMILMSGLLVYSILDLASADFNLYKSIVRILAAAILTYPAVYASRESTKHRNLETLNRNMELELASIGPFIEFLPDEVKLKVKEELANRYFGRQHELMDQKIGGSDDVSISVVEKILKAILPFVKR